MINGIPVGRIRTVPFSSNSAYNSVAYDSVETRMSGSEAEMEEQANHNMQSQALRLLSVAIKWTGRLWRL